MLVPVLITIGGVAAIGTTLYYLKDWAEGYMKPIVPPGPGPSPITDDKTADGKGKAPQGDRCSRTGERYDSARWSSPVHVAAGLLSLGYGVSPSLVTKDDKKAIIRFQKDAIGLSLNGMAGASSDWAKGKMGACTLLAMSNAEALLKAGKWWKRTPQNWFDKNWIPAMKKALEGS